jgi:hypothetical protein
MPSLLLTTFKRTVGGKVRDFPDIETARKVGIDHTLAAASAFATTLAPPLAKAGRKFPFVFCSGQGAEQKEDARVWLFSETRKIKVCGHNTKRERCSSAETPQGAVEKGLFEITAANPSFETFILRPGGVLPDNSRMTYAIASPIIPVIHVSDVAKGLLATCLTQPASKVIENKEIIGMAKNVS